MFNWISQLVTVTRFSLQTIPQRLGSSISAVIGIAGVVGVLVGVLSIAQGIQAMVENSGTSANAIVLRSGADSEMMSGLSGDQAKWISEAPGIAVGDGGPLSSAELFVILNLPMRSTGTDANVPLRGVQSTAFEVRETFEIVEGRAFEWGLNEVMVGKGAALEFAGLEVGSNLQVGSELWPIVGIFQAGGGISESEIWADAAVVQPAYRRGNSYQSVHAMLESSDSFSKFKDGLTTDPRLNVKVVREEEFYSGQSVVLRNIVVGLGTLIAGLMGLGAIFGALNTMYSAVSARTREIATLRALGFGSSPVILSILIEALVLAIVGGTLGGALAYLAFDGFRAATLNFQSFSQITFAFQVDGPLLVRGIAYATFIGFLGGLFPAIRAARLPVATALRES